MSTTTMQRARPAVLALGIVVAAVGCDDEGGGGGSESSAADETAGAGQAGEGKGKGKGKGKGARGHEPGSGMGPGDGTGGGKRREGHRRRRRRFPFPLAYLDGEPLGVVRFGELPPALEVTWVELDVPDQRKVRRFRWWGYLEALGVDPEAVTALHLYGGRGRVAVVGSASLNAHRKDLMFSFTRGDAGRLRMEWPPKMEINTTIDKVRAVAIYEGEDAPQWNDDEHRLELDGEPVEGVPYAERTTLRGTRVYLDGRIVTTLEPEYGRRAKEEAGEREPEPLIESIESQGVELEGVETVDLVSGDVLVDRVTPDELSEAKYLSVLGSRNRIRLLPSERQATALLLYAEAEPRDWETD